MVLTNEVDSTHGEDQSASPDNSYNALAAGLSVQARRIVSLIFGDPASIFTDNHSHDASSIIYDATSLRPGAAVND